MIFCLILSRRSRRRSFVRCLLWSTEAKNVTVAIEKHSKAYFVIYIFFAAEISESRQDIGLYRLYRRKMRVALM